MKMLQLCIACSLLGAAMAATAAQPTDAKHAAKQADAKQAAHAASAAKPAATSADGAPATPADAVALDTTQITGNRELPRVLYVVPWKRADLGDLSGRPARSLLDEVLAPVDRDVFRRQNRYHDALQPDAAPATAGGTADEPKVER